MTDIPYGPVFVINGRFKGHIMYYDDDEGRSTAICYAGHPADFVECYGVPARFLREPLVGDLLDRSKKISGILSKMARKEEWLQPDEIHALWSEQSLINGAMYERRMLGQMEQIASDKTVFLCHSSVDKGPVRMVNDDLRLLGAQTWLDENNIKVGQSIVGKISDGLKTYQFMALFLSKESVNSLWTTREWQSFLSRQLAGNAITILPVLLEECEIPAILADLKYANFIEDYHDGLKELHAALR